MKVWHDDIRRQPEGWEWCRTNQAAMRCLLNHVVDEISLDHDLGLHNLDPADFEKPELLRGEGEETGYDLVLAMCLLKVVPPVVTIHSWNPPGAKRMGDCLEQFGYVYTIKEYGSATLL